MPARILIADDDAGVRAGLVCVCRAAGHETLEAQTGREALELSRATDPDLVLLDLDMPEGGGLDVLPDLIGLERAPAVVILTGYADVGTAVRAMQMGAATLLEKPASPEALSETLSRVLEARGTRVAHDRMRDEVSVLRAGPVIGRSRAIHRVLEQVGRVASTPRSTVLITGESGVGKELVARAVHENSSLRDGPFVAVNCAALAESLLEAELFGYEAGAFTGGNPKGHDGLLAAAEGGTLFLDEVGELVPQLQAKLLRVLQERVYRRVGGNEDLEMDVRIVASTNRDLMAMVEEGAFREDLFYRLNVLSIVVPPLRERPEDITPISTHFLAHFGSELGRDFTGFSEGALERLRSHVWPGNVRELRNTIERAAILADEGQILPEHLGLAPSSRAAEPSAQTAVETFDLRSMEELVIRRALEACAGNRSQAARKLGINRTTLYNKIKAYGLE
ncbi:MAG: sigma-54-dependent Fis family transcriptional regulator [bacterium]|nr:sigma-54-dependent Fis family transcriptional regulator [bacterium]